MKTTLRGFETATHTHRLHGAESSVSLEIPRLLWKQDVNYRVT